MIKKISLISIVLCLFIAIPLSLMGISRVELGGPFMAFMKNCTRELENFKIEIPNIPMIPKIDDATGIQVVLNALVMFINGISSFLNILINILNIVISLLQFIIIVVKNLITFKDSLTQYVPNA